MKTILLPIMLLLFSVSTIAQPNRERIRALKAAHITSKLNLTEKEAQQFWPIYNTYDENTSKIKHSDIRDIRQEIKQSYGSLTDKQANNLLDRLISAENKLHAERVQLVSKLRNVISPQKIILLKVAEEDFNRKILEQMKKMRDKRLGNKKP